MDVGGHEAPAQGQAGGAAKSAKRRCDHGQGQQQQAGSDHPSRFYPPELQSLSRSSKASILTTPMTMAAREKTRASQGAVDR